MILYKYPRTFHVPWSLGVTNDDKTAVNLPGDGERYLALTKMDGENTAMYQNAIHARSVDYVDRTETMKKSRAYVRGLWAQIKHNIPNNIRICGENVYAMHSIHYDDLEDYFLIFSIWEADKCLSWQDTLSYTEMICEHLSSPIPTVPIIEIFDWTQERAMSICSRVDTKANEGVVFRPYGSFLMKDFDSRVLKWVRKDHVQTDAHWADSQLTLNRRK